MSFHPYVFFSDGRCAEAFRAYHDVLGGELYVMTNAEVPDGEEAMPGAEPHHVMHASITIGDGMLMGSDDPTGDDGPKTGVAVTYIAPDPEEARRVFEALSEGGEIQMPFAATFFSKGFGAFVDRYGVNWMIDIAEEHMG